MDRKLTKINLMEKFTIDKNSNSDSYKTIKEVVPKTTLFTAESTS